MMRAILLAGSFMLMSIHPVSAQINSSKNEKRLRIGDPMPDIVLKDIGNNKTKQKLSDFRGKLVILDFWGIYCSSCIVAMPKMQAIQDEFEPKVQVLLVTKNSDEQVEGLKKKIKILEKISLPMINNDTVLSKLFSFRTVPTHVWIDEKGVVRQITNGWETTAQNIKKYLGGEDLKLSLKNERTDFNSTDPLWLEGGGRQVKHLQYYSFIMGQITDTKTSRGPGLIYDSSKKLKGIQALNVRIIDLFRFALNEQDIFDFRWQSRNLLEFDHSQDFLRPENISKYEEWADKNLYCYELSAPVETIRELRKFMQQDLERFFGLTAAIEKRNVKCFVLKKNSTEDLLKPHSTAYELELNPFNTSLVIKNYPISNLVKQLQVANPFSSLPFLDETGYEGNIEVELNGDLTNVSTIKKELAKYGLTMEEAMRTIDMLVIKKN